MLLDRQDSGDVGWENPGNVVEVERRNRMPFGGMSVEACGEPSPASGARTRYSDESQVNRSPRHTPIIDSRHLVLSTTPLH